MTMKTMVTMVGGDFNDHDDKIRNPIYDNSGDGDCH